METIEVRYKLIEEFQGLPVYHKYLIYKDGAGDQFIVRGGPAIEGWSVVFPYSSWGWIKTEAGIYDASSEDWVDPLQDNRPRETIASAWDLSTEWAAIVDRVGQIESGSYAYAPLGQNSNALVDDALAHAGLPPAQLDGPGHYLSPSSDTPIFFPYLPLHQQGLPPALLNMLDPVLTLAGVSPAPAIPMNGGDPLVIDLNGDGIISLTSVEDGVHFDFHNDGFAEKTGWVAATDGMLVIDLDSNGLIDGYHEMLASPHSISFLIESDVTDFDDENGFAKLKDLDSNKDGVINAQDDVYTQLRIWQDLNQDGITQAGELKTLAEWDIASINWGGAALDEFQGILNGGFQRIVEGNTISHTSSVTLTNGTTREIVNAWLDHDLTNSLSRTPFVLDERTLFLPSIRGYGNLAPLHAAMSDDEDLLDMVADLAYSRTFEEMFAEHQDVREEVIDILYAWAGIDAEAIPENSQLSRGGGFEYMPEYQLLKKFTGMEHAATGPWFDERPFLPLPYAGIDAINETFDAAVDYLTARLLFQAGANVLFEPGVGYDPSADVFGGAISLSQDAIDDLETEADLSTDKLGFWNNVARYLDATVGLSSLTVTEEGWLDDAVDQSTSGAHDWSDVVASLEKNAIALDTYQAVTNGTATDDVITVADPTALGLSIYGVAGNDELVGSNGDDFLSGGEGDDFLAGGLGNDTYFYDWGHDVVHEVSYNYLSETNILEFGAGITLNDITVKYARPDQGATAHLIVVVEGRGTIIIQDDGILNSQPYEIIDTFRFADTTTIDTVDLDVEYMGSFNDEANLVPHPFTGVTTLYGFEGDDTLNGSSTDDILIGGSGDDILNGGSGDDIYVYESGNDIISELPGGGTDKIVFAPGITAADISIERHVITNAYNNGARIIVAELGSIVIENQFGGASIIELLEFADTSTINLAGIASVMDVVGTSGADVLSGNDTHPYLLQDRLIGDDGNDILDGGAGNDILIGGYGNDQYIVGEGFDLIEDLHGTDKLIFDNSYSPVNFSFVVTGNTHLDILYDGVAKVRILGQFAGRPIETLEIVGGPTINLTSLIYNQEGDDNNNIMYGITGGGHINNRLFGFGGNDQIYADNGDDFLQGGAGDDTLYGGFGNDIYAYLGNGYEGVDTIVDNQGIDLIQIGGDYSVDHMTMERTGDSLRVFFNAAHFLTIQNQFSTHTIESIEFADTSTFDLSVYTNIYGTSGGETLNGRDNALLPEDTIYGGYGNDTINGGAGNDRLYGEYGNDILNGGIGDDILEGAEGDDEYHYNIGDGHDTIYDIGGSADKIVFGVGITAEDIILERSGSQNVLVKTDTQTLITIMSQLNTVSSIETMQFADTSSINLLTYRYTTNGTSGNDNLNGLSSAVAGGDFIYAFEGNDTVYANTGDDFVSGGAGNDTLYGGGGNDILHGDDGNDFLYGEDGDDVLYGGDGFDYLYGGSGADTFVFEAVSSFNDVDRINDFSVGQGDKLDLADLLEVFDPLTDAITDFVQITDNGTHSYLAVDVDGGANNFVQIAELRNVTGLTDEDVLYTNGAIIV